MIKKLNLEFNKNDLEGKNWIYPELSFWNSWKFRIVYPELSLARYRVYEANWKGVAEWALDKRPFITLSKWLQSIISLKSWMEAVYQTYDSIDEPFLSYKAIDKETWNFKVFYDELYPRSYLKIDTKISKKELIETIYVWFTKRIIECYNWTKRYESQKISETEPLFDFFDIKIDTYLKEQWVDNINELVKKARDIIRKDMDDVYEMYDKRYFED